MELAALPPKRVRWTKQRDGNGAAVGIARRPKAQAISGTARVTWAHFSENRIRPKYAGMMELADVLDSKSVFPNLVQNAETPYISAF